MKRYYYILGIALITTFASCGANRYAQSSYDNNDQGEVTYQQFYDELSPYGNWISYPGYGYVWSPSQAGFMPYGSNGYWVYSTYGWTWVSNYNWGWAPFHYGRWMLDPSYGWLWVPGYQWAPAWVAWRSGGGYYGWAPLGPGMSVHIANGAVPDNHWRFVPNRYISQRNVSNYYVTNNTIIINNTTIINNYNNGPGREYNSGPRVNEVEKVTNTRIAPVRVINTNTPGSSNISNNQLEIYRPQVRQVRNDGRPSKIITQPVRKPNEPTTPVRTPNNNNTREKPVTPNHNSIDQKRPVETKTQDNNSHQPARPERIFTPPTNNRTPQPRVESNEQKSIRNNVEKPASGAQNRRKAAPAKKIQRKEQTPSTKKDDNVKQAPVREKSDANQ